MRPMKAPPILILPLFVILMASGCSSKKAVTSQDSIEAKAAETEPLRYVIDLNDRSDDLFKVTLTVDDLGSENAVYQFASTAPGTYQVMNMGRFVRSFTAVDGGRKSKIPRPPSGKLAVLGSSKIAHRWTRIERRASTEICFIRPFPSPKDS